jgi:hypothetical protein
MATNRQTAITAKNGPTEMPMNAIACHDVSMRARVGQAVTATGGTCRVVPSNEWDFYSFQGCASKFKAVQVDSPRGGCRENVKR